MSLIRRMDMGEQRMVVEGPQLLHEVQPADLSVVDHSQITSMDEDELLPWIDDEEAKATKYIVALRTIRNSKAPIYRLPDELLARIIFEATYTTDIYGRSVTTSSRSKERNKVINICRWWRGVALRQALLWTSINASRLDRAEAYLQRSKTALVDIKFHPKASVIRRKSVRHPNICFGLAPASSDFANDPPSFTSHFVDLLFEHRARIRTLSIKLTPEYIRDLFDQLTFPFPNLTFLDITSSPASGGIYDPVVFPLVFDEDNPSHHLKDVQLTHTYLESWVSPLLTGLRSLDLSFNGQPCRPSIPALLRILEDSPELQSLKIQLHGSFGPNDGSIPLPESPIEMKSLEVLSLTLSPNQLSTILSHLTLPRASVSLEAVMQDTDNGIAEVIPPSLVQRQGLGIFKNAELVEVFCDVDYCTFGVSMTPKPFGGASACAETASPQGCLRFDLMWTMDEELMIDKFTLNFRALRTIIPDSLKVRKFKVQGPFLDVTKEDLSGVLKCLPSLESLEVLCLDPLDPPPEDDFIFEALCMQQGHTLRTLQQSEEVVCPKLKSLVIDRFQVRKDWETRVHTCMELRKEHGALCLETLWMKSVFDIEHDNEDPDAFRWPDLKEDVKEFKHPDNVLPADHFHALMFP
ncbi:hypothetical protein ABKN59_004168 [Abortiporus biennis]